MDSIPRLNTLGTIRTNKHGETFDGSKKGEDHEQPLSPMARMFHEPDFNFYIICIIGFKTKLRPDVFKENMIHTILKNRRFSSLQVMDKENDSMKWIPTHVNIDDRVTIAELNPNIKLPDKFVENYISNISRSHIERTKPLWDFHILNIKTSEAEGTYTKTPMKGSKGVERRARRFVVRSVRLDDIKLVAGKLSHKVLYNTTILFSNVPGPLEEIMIFGHKVAYIAPSCYGQPNALLIHVVSYMDRVMFVISVDEETIPDPHKLCDDLEESLRNIKASAQTA
ncbi:hypothetical protein L1987_77694 [Smallanthus sonchifolius]|uniref:Uncharacterized protein n=1 Tax=Smallanthus sonchifolius TaxID=185202 RepID=A0ACB8Z9Q7_9ASTR|nr:hypothetical protein L1987_77694 [Smallanthus sonchifolius]